MRKTPPAAFTTFDRLRRNRVEKIVANGNRGSTRKAVGPVGRVLRDALLPVVFHQLSKNDSAAARWITNHHIDRHTHHTTVPTAPQGVAARDAPEGVAARDRCRADEEGG